MGQERLNVVPINRDNILFIFFWPSAKNKIENVPVPTSRERGTLNGLRQVLEA